MTNAAPQHKDLNQRIWLELENYLLDNANNRDLKISVFTGCIFNPRDIEYRGVKIPEEFWKVVVMVNKVTGQLHATGYILSQRRFIDNLEFVFGGFKTYQVTITSIEAETGLNFGNLKNFDPLRENEGFDHHLVNEESDVVI
ncbi:MAG: DNA/RNA non-specific endonuclease [Cyanobacteria bacterium J06642_3]